mgnify:CR=1 FL=1
MELEAENWWMQSIDNDFNGKKDLKNAFLHRWIRCPIGNFKVMPITQLKT